MKFSKGERVEFLDHRCRKIVRGNVLKGPKGTHRVYTVVVNGPDWYQVPEALMTSVQKSEKLS